LACDYTEQRHAWSSALRHSDEQYSRTGEKALNQIDSDKIESIKRQALGDPLSDGQVQDAIAVGTMDKNKSGDDIGLRLEDSGQKWSNAMSGMGNNYNSKTNQHSGFAVRMLTPRAWVEWNAHEAKRQYRPYTVADVTESDRLPVLRVIVKPDTPDYVVAGGGMRASSNVEHVILRSEDKWDAVQPLAIQPYQVDAKNAMGGSMSYNGVVAIFSIIDLDRLRKASERGEFLVTIVGEKGKEKDFKVKEKHFSHLD
jgi:hypothetical protein